MLDQRLSRAYEVKRKEKQTRHPHGARGCNELFGDANYHADRLARLHRY